MMAALIGVVRFNPSKKNSWFIATPNKPQSINLKKSFFLTLSFTKKRYVKKNNILPPITLNKIKPEGWMYSGITSFAIV